MCALDDDWEEAFFEDCRRADREDAKAWEEEAKMSCYMIGYNGMTKPPDYCKRPTMTEDELNECTCCTECCGCGG